MLPEPITEAIEYLCDSAVEMSGCHPGYAIAPEREYIAAVRQALEEALARLPAGVREALARRLEAAGDLCDANIALADSKLRMEREAALGLPNNLREPRQTRPASPRPWKRTANGQRRDVVLLAVAGGITSRDALMDHVAAAMGESDQRAISRNRTNSMLWSLANRGLLVIDNDSIRLPEPAGSA